MIYSGRRSSKRGLQAGEVEKMADDTQGLIERLRGLTFIDETGEAADALEAMQARVAELESALRELHDEIIPNWSKREALMFTEEALKGEGDEAGSPQ